MERIQVTRFSFRRKGSNREKKEKDRDAIEGYDFEEMSYLRWDHYMPLSLL